MEPGDSLKRGELARHKNRAREVKDACWQNPLPERVAKQG